MKKFLFLMLSAAVAVSASAGIGTKISKQAANIDKNAKKVERVTRGDGYVAPSTPITFRGWDKQFSHVMRSDAAITWDFEDEACFNEFQALDNDGDGYNWQYFNNSTAEKQMTAHAGYGLVASASYDNDTYTALTPDNWLISPQVTLGGVLSFWACGQDKSYFGEVFGVYVCVGTPDGTTNFVQVGEDYTIESSEMTQYEIDLSAYQGQVGCFAIVHHNITDMFWLNIDDITLDVNAVILPYPATPELNVTPAATSATIAWAADENADGWNLIWRPYVDISGNYINCDMNGTADEIQAQLDNADWITIDADGDNNNWGLGTWSRDTIDGVVYSDMLFYSDSYSSGALTPDNWLISRQVKLQGVFKFNAWGLSPYYPAEHVMPYVYVGEITDDMTVQELLDAMVPLQEEDIVCTEEKTEYSYDLSSYNGQHGYVALRHYNCTDQYTLLIDDICIGDPNAPVVEPAEWNMVQELTTPNYTIEGLTPGTMYEVAVQGYNAAHVSEIGYTTFITLEQAGKLGDVNKDGFVNISDVTALIDALLGGYVMDDTDNYSPDNANVNEDDTVDISDVTALIDLLLSGNAD